MVEKNCLKFGQYVVEVELANVIRTSFNFTTIADRLALLGIYSVLVARGTSTTTRAQNYCSLRPSD
jgi:hypothetical protein